MNKDLKEVKELGMHIKRGTEPLTEVTEHTEGWCGLSGENWGQSSRKQGQRVC